MESQAVGKEIEKLSLGRTLAYAAGVIPAAYSPALLVGWLMYFYYPGEGKGVIYMTLGAFVVVQFIGRLMDSVSDPLVGYFSDRTRSRWGRRIPYIIFGTPPMALTLALVWFPITDYPSMANNVWLAGNLLIFWLAYTIVVAPHLSLLPEIAPESKNRNQVGGWLGLAEVIGTLLGAAVFAILIDAYKEGLIVGPFHIADGFKLVGIIAGAGSLVLLWLTWWFIREKPFKASKEVPFNFYQAARETLKNPTYPHYLVMIALLRLLVDVIFVLLPYYVTRHLGLSEGFAGGLSGAIILGAVFFFPLIIWAANRYGKKKVFSLGLLSFGFFLPLPVIIPFLHLGSFQPEVAGALAGAANFCYLYEPSAVGAGIGGVNLFTMIDALSRGAGLKMISSFGLFALLAPGAAAFLVLQRVIITDVMDFDEKVTGYRREAMYNGIEGLVTKFAAGVAPMVVALNFVLFQLETGVLTAFVLDALIAFFAYWIFKPYPIEK